MEQAESTAAWDAYKGRREAELARAAAGMGFWRLVGVIATGIVAGLALNDAIRWVIVYLSHPPQ